MDPKSRRPWWTKKRWAAVLLLWLLLLYPLTAGPVFYAQTRDGWLSPSTSILLSRWHVGPARSAMLRTPAAEPFARYLRWCWFKATDDNSAAWEREARSAR